GRGSCKATGKVSVQSGARNVRESTVEHLAIKGVFESISRRSGTIGIFFKAGGPNELLSLGETFAEVFNLDRFKLQGTGYRPNGEIFASDAGTSQNELLRRTQSFELKHQDLLQRVWYVKVELFEVHGELPGLSTLRNNALLHQVLHDQT